MQTLSQEVFIILSIEENELCFVFAYTSPNRNDSKGLRTFNFKTKKFVR